MYAALLLPVNGSTKAQGKGSASVRQPQYVNISQDQPISHSTKTRICHLQASSTLHLSDRGPHTMQASSRPHELWRCCCVLGLPAVLRGPSEAGEPNCIKDRTSQVGDQGSLRPGCCPAWELLLPLPQRESAFKSLCC